MIKKVFFDFLLFSAGSWRSRRPTRRPWRATRCSWPPSVTGRSSRHAALKCCWLVEPCRSRRSWHSRTAAHLAPTVDGPARGSGRCRRRWCRPEGWQESAGRHGGQAQAFIIRFSGWQVQKLYFIRILLTMHASNSFWTPNNSSTTLITRKNWKFFFYFH